METEHEGPQERKAPLPIKGKRSTKESTESEKVGPPKKGTADGRPWYNEDGTRKPEDEIRILGRSWTPKIWERYLREEVESPEDDNLCFFADMDRGFAPVRPETSENAEERRGYKGLRNGLLIAFDELSPMERTIMKWLFWKQMDGRELAKAMGTTYRTVTVLKSRATKKLKNILPSERFGQKLRTLRSRGLLEGAVSEKKRWLKDDSL